MKKVIQLAPLFVLALVMFGCGGGSGGTAEPTDIGNSALSMIKGKDFDSVFNLTDQSGMDMSAVKDIRAWRIENGYDRWKDYKKRLEGDNGMDPKSKSEIDGEEKWKSMSYGKKWALDAGLYKVYAIDDLDKRLSDGIWAMVAVGDEELEVEGQGKATVVFANQYGDTISVRTVRKNGLWYLRSVKLSFPKETPKKPKDD